MQETRASRHGKRRWWRNNGLALIVLLPLAAAAVFASSYRLTDTYWSARPSKALPVDGNSATYRSSYRVAGKTYEREIDVRLVSVAEQGELHGQVPVDGAAQWAVSFEFTAPATMTADGCTLEVLDAEGRIYRPRAALKPAPGAPPPMPRDPCLVPGKEGPILDRFTGELMDSPEPRGASWRSTIGVAMPDGVKPAKVRLYWDTPNYVEFDAAP